MIYKDIELNVSYEKAGLSSEGCKAVLTTFVADISEEIGRHNRPAVLICPGGGYDYVSDREGEPIAFAFLAQGIQCFVLKYSVQKAFPTNLLEASAAMAYIRKHSYEYDINPSKVFCMGFSAGGHLAASLAVHWNKDFVKNTLGFTKEHRPDGSILCYPVISAADTHQRSIENLCRNNSSVEFKELISLDKQVTKDTPPAFIWHCADDGCVPVSNSIRYAEALRKNGISYSLHIYPEGGHGLALANEVTASNEWHQVNKDCEDWVRMAVNWIYK
ncbi:MAG: alpha/beta hydrolase [Lachnospiraceae bacterium]